MGRRNRIQSLSKELSLIEEKIRIESNTLVSKLKNADPIFINNNMNTIERIPAESGCYFFEIQISDNGFIQNIFSEFENKWINHKNNNFKCPSFNKSNAIKVYEIRNTYNRWFPLYIGKAGNLKERINQHIQCETPSTYALRIGLFNNDFRFRVKCIQLPENIISYCEKNIHKILHPLIGKG